MLIGYARVSTYDQNLDLQVDALENAGCERIFKDVMSGVKADRPGLRDALSHMREGDILVVWKLDRLGRSLSDLISVVTTLHGEGKGFKSLDNSFDTSTAQGTLIFQMFAVLAEFERNLIRERTMAGLTAARARGRYGGRPRKMDDKAIQMAATLVRENQASMTEIAAQFNVSRSTLNKALRRLKDDEKVEGKPGRPGKTRSCS